MAGESKLQRKCRVEAERQRVVVRKVVAIGESGWPDLELIFPGGETVRVEMKNPNKKGGLRAMQVLQHKHIRAQGAAVYTCDSYEFFLTILAKHLGSKK